MWDEFEHLYNTLFSNSESYIKIVEALSSKRGGLTRAEIVEQTKLNGNGDLTAVLQFIENNYGKDEQYWSNSTDNPARRTWEGLVFEQLCKDHVFAIKQKLGISGVLSEESAWFARADKESGRVGAQIDMLIKRRDRVITICEIKFSNGEYQIIMDDLFYR